MNHAILKMIGVFVLSSSMSIMPGNVASSQVTLNWDDSNGGIFDVAGSWTPTGIPGPLDTARFVFLNANTIPVTFFENDSIDSLEFNSGRFRFAGASQFGTGPVILSANHLTMENNGNLLMQHGLDDRSFRLEVMDQFDIAGRIVVSEGTALITQDAMLDSIVSNSPGEIALVGYSPDGEPSTWTALSATIGESRFGSVVANSGSKVTLENATLASDSGGSGEMDFAGKGFDGNPTTASIANLLVVGQAGSGMVKVRNGAQLFSETTFIAADSQSTGTVALSGIAFDHKGIWVNDGNLYVGGNNIQSGGAGELQVLALATAEIGQTLKIWDDGVVRMDSQSRLVVDAVDNNQGGEFNFLGGELTVNQFNGDLVNQGGSLLPGGDDIGSTFIFGSYTQQASSKLIIDIGGNNPGVDQDLVNLSDVAFLDGVIGLRLVPGFNPDPSDQFTILAAHNVLGFFDNVVNGQRLNTTNGEGSFVINYGIGSAFGNDLVVLSEYEPAVIIGDVNGDGEVDLLDVAPFVAAVTSTSFIPAADINQDGVVSLLDVSPFVELLTM